LVTLYLQKKKTKKQKTNESNQEFTVRVIGSVTAATPEMASNNEHQDEHFFFEILLFFSLFWNLLNNTYVCHALVGIVEIDCSSSVRTYVYCIILYRASEKNQLLNRLHDWNEEAFNFCVCVLWCTCSAESVTNAVRSPRQLTSSCPSIKT
jgi:hypothetical protein